MRLADGLRRAARLGDAASGAVATRRSRRVRATSASRTARRRVPARRRGAARASRSSAPTTTPTGPARARARGAARGDRRGPAAAGRARRWPTPRSSALDRLDDLRQPRRPAAGDLRPQPPQPRRHAAAAHARSPSRGGTSSSSPPPPTTSSTSGWKATLVRAGAQRHPDRARGHRPQSGRPDRAS